MPAGRADTDHCGERERWGRRACTLTPRRHAPRDRTRRVAARAGALVLGSLLVLGTTAVPALADGNDHQPPTPPVVPPGCTLDGRVVTCTYEATGETQTFTPPAGITSLQVTLTGASGGAGADGRQCGPVGGAGGAGATVTGTLTGLAVAPLALYVGSAGSEGGIQTSASNGGFGYGTGGDGGGRDDAPDTAQGGGGGGASAITLGAVPLGVAGAGGGGGGCSVVFNGGTGGASSADGETVGDNDAVAPGGTAGASLTPDGTDGIANSIRIRTGGGGGGGGGMRGGTGGSSTTSNATPGGGGGGGTNLAPPGGSATDGNHTGDGTITITYTA